MKLTNPIAVAAGTGACRVEGQRFRKGGGSNGAPYGVIVDGSFREYFGGETSGSAMVSFRTIPITGLGGHAVAPFFEYHASASPAAGDGLWLDEVALRCNSPLSVPPTYAFDQGTSMATPHVSGAAALLFSLKPTATVTEVRSALLGSTTPTASLAGKTVTGGRLNVAAAMSRLVPLTNDESPAGGGGTGPGATVSVEINEPPVTEANPPGGGQPVVTTCTVPKLAGKTLGQAKAALTKAKCKLGKVTSPKGVKPSKLAVKSSSPGAGSRTGGAVNLTLAPKPKPKHH